MGCMQRYVHGSHSKFSRNIITEAAGLWHLACRGRFLARDSAQDLRNQGLHSCLTEGWLALAHLRLNVYFHLQAAQVIVRSLLSPLRSSRSPSMWTDIEDAVLHHNQRGKLTRWRFLR